MTEPFIVDAHLHIGQPGVFFAPEAEPAHLLARMDQLGVAYAVCTDHLSIFEGCEGSLDGLREVFEGSGGRVHYLGVFDPRRSKECLDACRRAREWPGFVGLKIHPSFHGTPPEDPSYEPVWRFAGEHGLPILTHSWSVSDYNPRQHLSTPGRFEHYARQFGDVRLVLGHAGGRGTGRHEAVRLASECPNVYLDFAGDVFCHRLIETLVESVPADRILFGSDFPWLDPRAHLSQVLLADIDVSTKAKILRENAIRVYGLGAEPC